jgi:hypothetical protein
MKKTLILILLSCANICANKLLIPMDTQQNNHLKAYGLVYWWLAAGQETTWLLNYEGGSFMADYRMALETECRIRGISYQVVSDAAAQQILTLVSNPNYNMDAVQLTKTAKIAVYSPKKVSVAAFEDTDAVLLALNYAEIPYTLLYDEEIMNNELHKYDWLHLHHEDFTGQFGKNLNRMSQADKQAQQDLALRFGYARVADLKLQVAKAIKAFCAGGGYLFAMCSGAESLDVALAAEGIDIVPAQWDGNPADPHADDKLNFDNTLAFGPFTLESNPDDEYGGGRRFRSFSSINASFTPSDAGWGEDQADTFFNLFAFSAKYDVIPALLTQNHENQIREFMGQTNAFSKNTVKASALILGSSPSSERYIYGEIGHGQFAFYGGHDPEGRRGFHRIPTDLALFPHSPGYRLILNNVLFPSAHKKKRKT